MQQRAIARSQMTAALLKQPVEANAAPLAREPQILQQRRGVSGQTIPVRRLLPKDTASPVSALAGLNLQYRMMTSDRAALRVRALRLEPAQ